MIAQLGTICLSRLRIGQSEHTFPRFTKANPVQAKALQILDVKLSK